MENFVKSNIQKIDVMAKYAFKKSEVNFKEPDSLSHKNTS